MKETKILLKARSKLQEKESFEKNYQEELNKYINENYKIIASNVSIEGYNMYYYTLLEKEN